MIERFSLSLKNEFLRRLTLPYNFPRIEALLGAYHFWYNHQRPMPR